MSLLRSNGRPEPEVIVNFNDGFAYSKAKLEEAFRPGGILEHAPPKPAKESHPNLKREDVDVIVQEFEIPRSQAERHLAAHNGDLEATLQSLVTP